MALGLHNIHFTPRSALAIRYPEGLLARFWAKVERGGPDACWLWTANRVGRRVRHGQFTLPRVAGQQRHVYAHRFSWEIHCGPIPGGLQVCHHCDVPHCVNPAHLFLGTQDDNMKDAAHKGRLHAPRTRTLTPAQRLAIYWQRPERGGDAALARQYGVSRAAISRIRHGRFIGGAEAFERVAVVQLQIRGEVA